MLLAAVRVLALTGGRGSTRVPIYSLTSIERWIETLPEQDRKLLLEYDVEAEFWRDCALSDAQRAGIDHSRTVKPNAYLGCKPSYDRATFDRISLALNSASPPIGHRQGRGLVQAGGIQVEGEPGGCVGCVGRVGHVTVLDQSRASLK